jgi:Taurine catabolism dioxygenase TauD, TfdA family
MVRQFAEKLKPVIDPAGWMPEQMRQAREWLHPLSDREIADLDQAIADVERRGIAIENIRKQDFRLPVLDPVLDEMRAALLEGRGFAVIRGVPVQRYTRLQSAIAFWGIGSRFGDPVSQNRNGHLLGHVKDLGGATAENPNDRGYHTAEMLPFHVDGVTDVVGLLCLQEAKSGGESALASSVTIHNEMLRRSPASAAALAEPIYRDRRGEVPAGAEPYYPLPIFNYHDGYLTTNYQGGNIRSARRFSELRQHSPDLRDGLEMFEELAKELCFTMTLEKGDLQLLNNHTIVHSRISAVEDYPEPDRKRHLLRLRMMTPGGRPLPPTFFAHENLSPERIEPGQRPSGAIVAPGSVLKVPLEAE